MREIGGAVERPVRPASHVVFFSVLIANNRFITSIVSSQRGAHSLYTTRAAGAMPAAPGTAAVSVNVSVAVSVILISVSVGLISVSVGLISVSVGLISVSVGLVSVSVGLISVYVG